MRIIGVDPGGTCGWAYLNTEDLETFNSGELPPFELENWFDTYPDILNLVACERFVIGPETIKKSFQPDALYTIGVLDYLCQRRRTEFLLQSAGDAKGMVTNPRLKALELYRPGKPHANDAARQAILAAVKKGWYDPAQLVEGD